MLNYINNNKKIQCIEDKFVIYSDPTNITYLLSYFSTYF